MKNGYAITALRFFLRYGYVPSVLAILVVGGVSLRIPTSTNTAQHLQARQPGTRRSIQSQGIAPQAVVHLNHDFGRVTPGETLTHVFSIENKSDISWTIKKISTGCSCTMAQPQSNLILPNSAQSFEVTYKSPIDFADDKRIVTVQFHEQHTPLYELAIAAQVRRPLSIEKRNLHYAGLAIGNSATQDLQIENYSNEEWDGVNIDHDQNWLISKIKYLGKPNDVQAWRISVTASAENLSAGNHAAILRIAALTPVGSYVSEIPISATVVADVTISPSTLFFGRVEPHASISRTVVIRWRSSQPPPQLEEIELTNADDPQLTAKIDQITTGVWRVAATLTTNDVERRISGSLAIRNSESGVTIATVPFVAETIK